MLIYKLTNRVNGGVYIGKYIGNEADARFQQHVREARRGGDRYLCRAIRKYGSDSFKVEVIYRAKTADELSKMETFFIILHQSHKSENGYNMTLGGEGTVGRVVSERTRQLWSNQRKGRPVTAQQLENLALGHHRIRPKKMVMVKTVEEKDAAMKAAMRDAWTPERRTAQAQRVASRNRLRVGKRGALSMEWKMAISNAKKGKAASAAA